MHADKPIVGRFRAAEKMPVDHAAVLKRIIDQHPCHYLEELQADLIDAVFVFYSIPTITRTLEIDLDYSRKKVNYYAQQRELSERMNWMTILNSRDFYSTKVICIEESHMTKSTPRT
jgi:hypothetical protein